MRAPSLTLLAPWIAVACGPSYVDPTPPELAHVQVQVQSAARPEPIVYAVIIDLFVGAGGDCAGARRWIEQAVDGVFAAHGPATKLMTQDLSPDCSQPQGRRLDVQALRAATAGLVSTHPGQAIRPVLIYANNVNIDLPGPLAGDLFAALSPSDPRILPSLLWVVGRPIVQGRLHGTWTMDWTYVGDSSFPARFGDTLSQDLPLSSDLENESFALLPPSPVALAAKVCLTGGGEIKPSGFSTDGTAFTVSTASPPRLELLVERRVAFPRRSLTPRTAHLDLEICQRNCSRFVAAGEDGAPRRWLELRGCLQPGVEP